MFLTKEQFEERLKSERNLCNVITKKIHNGGKPKGAKNHSEEFKVTVGSLASILGVNKTAESLQMDPAYVSRLKNGKTHNDHPADDKIVKKIEEKKEQGASRALILLEQSLGLISEEDIAGATLTGKTALARDMSVIIRNLSEDKRGPIGSAVIIYTPGQAKEDTYKTITVGADNDNHST